MKKLLIAFVLLVAFVVCGKAQTVEPVFTIEGDTIACKSKFIDSLYFDYQGKPDTLFQSYVVTSSSGQYAYEVALSDYICAMGDGGYFRIIDIKHEGKSILQLNQSDGWDKLPEETKDFSEFDTFLVMHVDENTTALIFTGYPYASDPEQITIVVLHKGTAKMVFNKHYIINKVEKVANSLILTLHDQVIEYDDDGNINTTNIFKLWNEDGELKFGGSYGMASSNY